VLLQLCWATHWRLSPLLGDTANGLTGWYQFNECWDDWRHWSETRITIMTFKWPSLQTCLHECSNDRWVKTNKTVYLFVTICCAISGEHYTNINATINNTLCLYFVSNTWHIPKNVLEKTSKCEILTGSLYGIKIRRKKENRQKHN